MLCAARQEVFGSHPAQGSSDLISSRPSDKVFETFTDVSTWHTPYCAAMHFFQHCHSGVNANVHHPAPCTVQADVVVGVEHPVPCIAEANVAVAVKHPVTQTCSCCYGSPLQAVAVLPCKLLLSSLASCCCPPLQAVTVLSCTVTASTVAMTSASTNSILGVICKLLNN